jgi:hypothetical protein
MDTYWKHYKASAFPQISTGTAVEEKPRSKRPGKNGDHGDHETSGSEDVS